MKLVGVCACTVGIAHTYIAKEKLENAAKKRGYQIEIETQGTIGTEDELSVEAIKNANAVILAVDVKFAGEERFSGKRIIKVPTGVAVKSPNKLLDKVEEVLASAK